MKCSSAGEVRLFAIVSGTEKSEGGLGRIVHMPDSCPFLSGLLQVYGVSQSHILLFVSHESSFLLTGQIEEQSARRMTLINLGRSVELVGHTFLSLVSGTGLTAHSSLMDLLLFPKGAIFFFPLQFLKSSLLCMVQALDKKV